MEKVKIAPVTMSGEASAHASSTSPFTVWASWTKAVMSERAWAFVRPGKRDAHAEVPRESPERSRRAPAPEATP